MAAYQEFIQTLSQTWGQRPGALGWLTAVNHRAVGLRFIVTGLVFFGLAGIAALLMRIQLAVPENTFLGADRYNQIFTMHGTTMMFLFAVPALEGVGIYLAPLMIGARDMAYPRLNAFGYWIYLFGGVGLWLSLFFGVAPDGGWFNYPPLTDGRFSPGLNIDYWLTFVTLLEVSALVAAVELVATILFMRAPGMSIMRMPLFVWAILVVAFMILYAMPPLMVASLALEMDRKIGTHFYNAAMGGDPVLWQHLFWFFGHPEVYIILLPALGIVSAIIATFSRRPVIGYLPLVVSFIAIGIIGFGLWTHHMFAIGRALLGKSVVSVASMLIAIPSGIQIFAALATFWHGRLWLRTPLLYVFGFIFIFVLGGITGVMVASVPFDLMAHDTYFVVAHFHYVLIGGALFPLLGGLVYWFPKFTGRMTSETLGTWAFWLIFLGFNITFLTMHITGLLGMPRRVYTYLAGLGWESVNLISTVGAFVLASGLFLYLLNFIVSWRNGAPAGPNPWQSGTLEWAADSPPAPYNFASPPNARHEHPLWLQRPGEAPNPEAIPAENERFGLQAWRRESLGSSPLDATPQQRLVLPGPSLIPLFMAGAVTLTFLGLVYGLVLIPIGAAASLVALYFWHRPRRQDWDMNYVTAGAEGGLPTNMVASSHGVRSTTWWGMIGLAIILVMIIGTLAGSYFYLRSRNYDWPVGPFELPNLILPAISSVALLAALVPLVIADWAARRGKLGNARLALLAATVLVGGFVGLQIAEVATLEVRWDDNAYGSLVWVLLLSHLVVAVLFLLVAIAVMIYAWRGYFNDQRFDGIVSTAMIGYATVATWVLAAATLYVLPYIW